MSIPCDVSNVPQSEIFWGALPAITRAALEWRGECGAHFGIYLINFWTAEPGAERDLWSSGKTILCFVHLALEKHATTPWEKACLERIIEIGVLNFTPAMTPSTGNTKR